MVGLLACHASVNKLSSIIYHRWKEFIVSENSSDLFLSDKPKWRIGSLLGNPKYIRKSEAY